MSYGYDIALAQVDIIEELFSENTKLRERVQDAHERIAELVYELEQERIHNRNLNKAYDNLARLRSVDAQ